MATINIPESERCTVVGVVFRCNCNKCNMVWDVYMDGETPPDLWDVCRNCLNMLGSKPTQQTSTNDKYRFTKILAKYPFLTNGYTGETYKGE